MTSYCLSEYTGAKGGGGEEEVSLFSSLPSLLFHSTMNRTGTKITFLNISHSIVGALISVILLIKVLHTLTTPVRRSGLKNVCLGERRRLALPRAGLEEHRYLGLRFVRHSI